MDLQKDVSGHVPDVSTDAMAALSLDVNPDGVTTAMLVMNGAR